MAYNPMAVVYGEHFSRVFTSDEAIRTSHSRHRSSFLNREKSLAQENVLALEVSGIVFQFYFLGLNKSELSVQVMMARSATKFRTAQQDGAMQDHEIDSRVRGEHERNVLTSMLQTTFQDQDHPTLDPEIKLLFILKFFKLDEGKDAVKDFETFFEDLRMTLFAEFKIQDFVLARALSLHQHMHKDGNLPEGIHADLKARSLVFYFITFIELRIQLITLWFELRRF